MRGALSAVAVFGVALAVAPAYAIDQTFPQPSFVDYSWSGPAAPEMSASAGSSIDVMRPAQMLAPQPSFIDYRPVYAEPGTGMGALVVAGPVPVPDPSFQDYAGPGPAPSFHDYPESVLTARRATR